MQILTHCPGFSLLNQWWVRGDPQAPCANPARGAGSGLSGCALWGCFALDFLVLHQRLLCSPEVCIPF